MYIMYICSIFYIIVYSSILYIMYVYTYCILYVYNIYLYLICRYLFDENRNMMISSSSGRSGVNVILIIYNNIICNSIIPCYSPI